MVSSALFVLFFSSLLLSSPSQAKPRQPLVDAGLSWTFYDSTCPDVETIVRDYLQEAFKADIGLAAGLLRLHFHDCFVQGCDGSVLLAGDASNPSEQASIPNLTLRQKAFDAINELRDLLQNACGLVVSCADITTIAARESVFQSGGPYYDVPLGRRDSLTFASNAIVLTNIPGPSFNVTTLLNSFARKKLDATDLVALSGAHTIGVAHCRVFTNRLFPSQDPTLDDDFAKTLYATCPEANSSNTTFNDFRTPSEFDNQYYVDLVNKEGLFTSDEGLFFDYRTWPIVRSFALSQWWFFEKFAEAMIKMSQVEVLTGSDGEIRMNCSVANSFDAGLASVEVGGGFRAGEKPAV